MNFRLILFPTFLQFSLLLPNLFLNFLSLQMQHYSTIQCLYLNDFKQSAIWTNLCRNSTEWHLAELLKKNNTILLVFPALERNIWNILMELIKKVNYIHLRLKRQSPLICHLLELLTVLGFIWCAEPRSAGCQLLDIHQNLVFEPVVFAWASLYFAELLRCLWGLTVGTSLMMKYDPCEYLFLIS